MAATALAAVGCRHRSTSLRRPGTLSGNQIDITCNQTKRKLGHENENKNEKKGHDKELTHAGAA